LESAAFYKYFTIVSISTAVLLFALCQFPLLQPYLIFSVISLALFMLLTLLMFVVGGITAKSSNKNLFTTVILGFTFGKIFLSLFVVLGYHQLAQPPSKIFLLPFFIVYLVFTIFETYLMMQIGQHSN